jgi:Alginate export
MAAVCIRASGAERPAFQTLRYNEDWTFLQDAAQRTDWLDSVKFVPLESTNVYLSFGGEARLKYELYSEPVFNQQPADDNGFLLQRYLLHTDFHVTPYFRVFGQLQSSLEDFRNGGPRPTDRDELDLHQAFFDARAPLDDNDDSLTLRVGRQEMAYGSQRLISVRESPNNRRAFDAVRALSRFGAWRVDGWLSQPVEIDPGFFNDRRDPGWTFWGVYATGPVNASLGLNADFYYLGSFEKDVTYARGTANERRQSLGTRLFGHRGALDYNFEFVGQFGSFGNDGIFAWTAASDTGWRFSDAPTQPRVFLHADIASGDHGGANLGTFNPLFPKAAYFNDASLIGPLNLMDLQPGVELALTKCLTLTASCDFVWRESLDDGVYDSASNLVVAPGASSARYVGTFPTATLSWQIERHLNVTLNYVAYLFGEFVGQSSPSQRNGNYFSAAATFRF